MVTADTLQWAWHFLAKISPMLNADETLQWPQAFFSLKYHLWQGLLKFYGNYRKATVGIFTEDYCCPFSLQHRFFCIRIAHSLQDISRKTNYIFNWAISINDKILIFAMLIDIVI